VEREGQRKMEREIKESERDKRRGKEE